MVNKKVTLSLPEDLVLEAKNKAFQKGQSFSGMVRTQIKKELENEIK